MSTLTINQLYQALGRDPDPGGLSFWSGYTGPNLAASFEAAARAAGETYDPSRIAPLSAVNTGPSTISINAPTTSSLTLSSQNVSPLKAYSASSTPVTVDLNLPSKPATTTVSPDLYGPPSPVTSAAAPLSTNVEAPTKVVTAQDALDYFNRTGDTVGMYKILAESAGMPNLSNEQAATGVVENIFQKNLGRDPDPVGLEGYKAQVLSGVPYEKIVEEVRSSPEYVAKQERDVFTPPVFAPDVNQILQAVGIQDLKTVEPEVLSAKADEVARQVKQQGFNEYMDLVAQTEDLFAKGQLTPDQYKSRLDKAKAFNQSVEEKSNSVRQAVLNRDLYSTSTLLVPEDLATQIQDAARVVYGGKVSEDRLRKIATDFSTGAVTQQGLLAALAYSAETPEEKARANTLLGYNFHEVDPAYQIAIQLEDQYKTINSQTGYKYRYEDRLPTLFKNQADALANAGVESIYDVGVKLVGTDTEINVLRQPKYDDQGNFTGEYEYLKQVGTESSGETETPIYAPLNLNERAQLKEVATPDGDLRFTTLTEVPRKVLYNTQTGEPLKTGFREEGALRDYQGLDIWGGANLGKGLDLFGVQVTGDGQPVFLPIWQETSDKATIAQIAAVLATPFAPQLGSYLYGLSGAAAAAAGAATISGATQLIGTGKIDLGQLAVSAGTAYLGADVGLTGADIAADAAQLAAQGLNSSQIGQVIAATGVNQATATIAANLAVAGVSASVAPMITSSLLNMGMSGLNAAVTGQDVGDAMLAGALTGAGKELSVKVIDNMLGAENINTIARETGLLPNQVRSIGVSALSNAISAEAVGSGDFLKVLGTDLVANGLSFSAANKISSHLDSTVSSKQRAAIIAGIQETTNVATRAAISGQDVGQALSTAAPFIAAKAASAAVQTPSDKPKEEGKVEPPKVDASQVPPRPVVDENKPTVSGVIDGSGFKTPEEAMQYAKSQGEQTVQWGGKTYREAPNNTVTGIPDGSGFKTPEEAIRWANSIGENTVSWGGKFYKNETMTEVWNSIESSKTFGDAYAKARDAFGPGAVFTWNGKQYSTDTKEENPSLAKAKDQVQNIEQGVGGPKGTYSGYDEKEMANVLAMIDDNAINQAVSRPSGEVDFITDAVTGKQTPVYGDKISKDLITPVVRTVGVLTRGTGSTLDFTSGFLQSIEVIDKNSPMVKLAKDLTKVGEHQLGGWALDQEKQFIQKVSDAEGLVNKSAALAQAIIEHPMAVLTLSANEVIEELPSVLAMLASGGAAGVARLMSLGAGGITNYIEGAGAGYNEARDKALAAGKTEAEAHAAGQKSALAAGATQAVLGTFAESPLIKKGFGAPGTIGTAVKREVTTEIPEEFAQTGFADYFGTGSFDMNNALTAAVIAPVIAGTSVTAIGTAVSVARSGDAATEMINAVDPQNSSQIINQVNTALQSSSSIQDAGNKITSSLQEIGFSPEQAVSIANTVATEQFVNNINDIAPEGSRFSIDNINRLIGATANGNPVTLGDYIGATLTGKGEQMFVTPDLVIGTKNDGNILTVGDISGALISTNLGTETKTETNSDTGTKTTTTVSQNPETNATTETKVETDPSTNTTTESTVTTNPDSVIATDTVVNPNTNTQVDISSKVDTNTATATAVVTNTITNVKTNIDLEDDIATLVAGGMSPFDAMKVVTENVKDAAKRGTDQSKRGAGSGGGMGVPMFGEEDSGFQHGSLFTRGPRAQFESPLEAFLRQMQSAEPESAPQAQPTEYFSYGTPSDIDEILAQESGVIPTDVIPSGIGTSFRMPSVFGGMKAGGPALAAGGPLTIAAGKIRRDYRQGDAVEGPGDGQSDDIPAMLADGEYVIDAEIVAALGNGSNKAGAELLDKFREEIRRHKRGGSLNEIPPQSKSPLQYLAAAKKKVSKR